MRTLAAPLEGTKEGTYHWLYRPTGAPSWMVAMMTKRRAHLTTYRGGFTSLPRSYQRYE